MSNKHFTLTSPEGGSTELPVHEGSLGPDVVDISGLYRERGVFTYDPGFMATASCESKVTFIDGAEGVLLYRGYPVEQLAEHSSFIEVCYLLLYGDLPSKDELEEFESIIRRHTMLNESVSRFFMGFRYDAHPMAMLSAVVGSMSAFYHDTMDIHDERQRDIFAHRIIAKLPTIAAAAYKHSIGQPFIYPRNDLDYCSNLLNMFFAVPAEPYHVDPVAAEALDLLFILHADHEQNCSTSTVRMVASGGANLFASLSAGISALWGPLHGGANTAVIQMLLDIHRDGDDGSRFIDAATRGEAKLMGFGHRVYKNYDPRAKILQKSYEKVLAATGRSDPLMDIARRIEERALSESYFVDRKLYPNVDFYSGLILKAIGLPLDMYTVMFAIGRMPGWIANWKELADSGARIHRPRQIYIGHTRREYLRMRRRDGGGPHEEQSPEEEAAERHAAENAQMRA
jgi:citrate synthase